MSLIKELQRRNVIRAALFYLAGSWLLIQVAETIFPLFGLPDAAARMVVIILAIGFLPVLIASWAFEWTPDGFKKDEGSASGYSIDTKHAKAWDRVILVVLALAVGMFAFDRFVLAPQREADIAEAATQAGVEMEKARASVIPHESVAVLPFVNMSGDVANEYFSDGLTETLLHMLAQLADLKVAARTSSFAFKDQNVDIRTIGEALSVAHILEGSVQKSGNRIRVTAQLIRAGDGYHVWSQNYDRTLDDIFAIQDEIAADVAGALGSMLLAVNDTAVAGPFTSDANAYDIYLQALAQQAVGTLDALYGAEALLSQALEKDPAFVDAKTALVRNSMLISFSAAGRGDITREDLHRLLAEVLEENPGDLVARQYDLLLRSEDAVANMDLETRRVLMEELVESFQEGDGDLFLRRIASNFLVGESRPDEALALLQEALVSDPLNVDLLLAQGNLLLDTAGPDAAEQPFRTALTLQPDNPQILWRLGGLEFSRWQVVDGLRYMRKMELVDPLDPGPTAEITATLTEVGLYESAERWMADYKSRLDDPAMAIDVEIQTAAERGDEVELRRIVPGALAHYFEGKIEGRPSNVLLNEYAVLMIREGRAQEGLDYIDSFYPGIAQISSEAVTGWAELSIRTQAVAPLFNAVSDEATQRAFGEETIAVLVKSGIVIEEDNPSFVQVQYILQGIDAAKAAFFSIYDEDMYILSQNWHHFKRAPWAADLRADPDVIAAMEAREVRIAELRWQVLDMMKEPEWQVMRTE